MRAAAYSVHQNVLLLLAYGGAVAVGIWGTLRRKRSAQRRSLDLQTLAARLQFDDFNPHRDEEFVIGWGFLTPLALGEDRYAFNILRGTYHGQALFVFDYHYRTGSDNNQQDHYGTMLMLIVKEAFPKVTLGPEKLKDKLEGALGLGDEIKFESAEFSRKFCVRSADKKFAYDVCHPQMMEYLLANPGLQIEIQGPVISLAFAPQLPAGRIEFNLQRLVEIRSRLPQYLFTNQ